MPKNILGHYYLIITIRWSTD